MEEVHADSFTHGTSAQSVYWCEKGDDTGDMSQGDTFNTKIYKKQNIYSAYFVD
ncbi:MAG: neutral zinc metallopeptidase [Pedobacter sp.]|nr:neutral zinc metallopeptidase [Pedobacter sp.]